MFTVKLPVVFQCGQWCVLEHYENGDPRYHPCATMAEAERISNVPRIKWAVLRWVYEGSGGQWGAGVHDMSWGYVCRLVSWEIGNYLWDCGLPTIGRWMCRGM